MAFTTDQRAQIRKYLGFALLFTTGNPILEGAMNAVDQLNDGGSTENAIVQALTQLTAIEAQIVTNSQLLLASEVTGELKLDALRADAGLRRIGTSLINQIAIPLATSPVVRYFYPMPLDPSGEVGPRGYDQ